MADFKPHTPYNVPFKVLTATTKYVKGVLTKTYTELPDVYWCSFRTFGGTESTSNGMTVVEDTATLETWYDPVIASDCRLEVDGQMYEVLGTPEDINKRHQHLVVKVRAVKGGA